MNAKSTQGALNGVRVLDLSHALAGPVCGQMLADHGANVIKIEPLVGDVLRGIEPFTSDDHERKHGGLFQNANRNKRGMALDLKTPEARVIFLKLVEQSDVVIENFRAGVMDRLGLGYDVLAQHNQRIVYTAIRGFGDPRSGETVYSDLPCVDIVAQAMSGLMNTTGPDEFSPTMLGGNVGDTIPGLFGAFATMIALWEARASGKGQYVDVAMTDALLAISGANSLKFAFTGQVDGPVGNRYKVVAPFGRVRTKDGWAVMAAPPGPGKYWEKFCDTAGRPEWKEDLRFSTPQSRLANADAVYAAVEEFTSLYTKEELLRLLGGKLPFGPIYTAEDIARDPYFATRAMLSEIDQPVAGRKVAVLGVPPKLSRTPGSVRHRAPKLGEHTGEILESLGYTETDIAALVQAGAILGVAS